MVHELTCCYCADVRCAMRECLCARILLSFFESLLSPFECCLNIQARALRTATTVGVHGVCAPSRVAVAT